jgi:SAM-dependent methyltransferase
MKAKLIETLRKNIFDEMGIYWAEIADRCQTESQIQFIKNTLKPQGLVLDLACGSGRHLIALSKEGYEVVGLDISLKLLKIAKSRIRDTQVVRADMRFLPFKPQAFSAAISMDQSYGYLPSEHDDLKSLSELHGVLGVDGILIVDVFNRERLVKRFSGHRQMKLKEFPSFWLLQERTVTKQDGELRDQWTIRDKTTEQLKVFEHVARLYTLSGFGNMLEKVGFNVKAVYGDYEMHGFSADSSRLIMVATSCHYHSFRPFF